MSENLERLLYLTRMNFDNTKAEEAELIAHFENLDVQLKEAQELYETQLTIIAEKNPAIMTLKLNKGIPEMQAAIVSLLFIFDRELEEGTIGRNVCDKARACLNIE